MQKANTNTQGKMTARPSKWGLLLLIGIFTIFLCIYGYAAFVPKHSVEEESQDIHASADTQTIGVIQYLEAQSDKPVKLSATPAQWIQDLEQQKLEEEKETEVTEPSNQPVDVETMLTELVAAKKEQPHVVEELVYPDSFEVYENQIEKKISNNTSPSIKPAANIAQPQLPPAQPNPFDQAAALFAQQLQQQRYSGLLQALQSSSSVQSQTAASKEQLYTLAEDPRACYISTQGPTKGTMLDNAQPNNGAMLVSATNAPQPSYAQGYQPYAEYPQGNMQPNTDYNTTGISAPQTLQAYQGLVNPNTTLKTYVEPVASPFLLRQGVVIPCVLLTGINSDLPGFIQAQVTQDVFDSPLGLHLLIPQGSKIVGQYASAPKLGQQRLMLAFNRIIFPDGKAMSLGAMPGSSLDGYSGFEAEVDNHFWQLMTNAILLGGITAGISLSIDEPRDDNGDLTVNGALTQSLGQSIGRVLTQVIERNLVISPTLKVQPGLEFNVTLIQDIYFSSPYHSYN